MLASVKTEPVSNALRNLSMKPSDMPLPLLHAEFGRSFTSGISGMKPGSAGMAGFSRRRGGFASAERQRSWLRLLLGHDRCDLVARAAFVDVDEGTQPDPRQLADFSGACSADFAAWRRTVF